MQLITTTTVGAGGASSITFSSIPGTYTDLVLTLSARATSTSGTVTLNLNGSATGFTFRNLQSTHAAMQSQNGTTNIGNVPISTDTANTFGNMQIIFPNYAGSTNKPYQAQAMTENNATAAFTSLYTGTWSNTSAITSITLNLANFAQNTTASLYGVLKGSGGATVS